MSGFVNGPIGPPTANGPRTSTLAGLPVEYQGRKLRRRLRELLVEDAQQHVE